MTMFEASTETRRAGRFGAAVGQQGVATAGVLLAGDEQRIRRVIRCVIERAHLGTGQCDVQCVFDLLPYLRAEAAAIVEDEAVHTLAEIVGGD